MAASPSNEDTDAPLIACHRACGFSRTPVRSQEVRGSIEQPLPSGRRLFLRRPAAPPGVPPPHPLSVRMRRRCCAGHSQRPRAREPFEPRPVVMTSPRGSSSVSVPGLGPVAPPDKAGDPGLYRTGRERGGGGRDSFDTGGDTTAPRRSAGRASDAAVGRFDPKGASAPLAAALPRDRDAGMPRARLPMPAGPRRGNHG